MKLLLLFNPRAAIGRAANLLPRIARRLERFAAVEVLQAGDLEDARERVAGTDLGGYDALVAAGGDGTLFAALNGLYRHELRSRPVLGVLPVGTGNAFARDLGLLPGQWAEGAAIIEAGAARAVDVGEVETPSERYFFLNIVGTGLPASAMKTAQRLKLLGRGAYSLAVLWEILNLKSTRYSIEIDGKDFSGDYVFTEISNTRYTGTSFLIAPRAVPDDGLLDVTLLKPLSRRRLFRLFPTIYSGGHTVFPEVQSLQAREVRLAEPAGTGLAPDGELYGRLPARVRCLRRDLRIFFPD